MKLPAKCIQDKIFLNSTGYKYCMLRDPGSENSMLECKEPESGLRLPTYIAPIKQLIRYKGGFNYYPSSLGGIKENIYAVSKCWVWRSELFIARMFPE